MIFIQQKKNFFHILLYIFSIGSFYITGEKEVYHTLKYILKDQLTPLLQKGRNGVDKVPLAGRIVEEYNNFFKNEIRINFIKFIENFKKDQSFMDLNKDNYEEKFYLFIINHYINEIILPMNIDEKNNQLIKDNLLNLINETTTDKDENIIKILESFSRYNISFLKFVHDLLVFIESTFTQINFFKWKIQTNTIFETNNIKKYLEKKNTIDKLLGEKNMKNLLDTNDFIKDPNNLKIENLSSIDLNIINFSLISDINFEKITYIINTANQIINTQIRFKKGDITESNIMDFKKKYHIFNESNFFFQNNNKFIEILSILFILKNCKNTNIIEMIEKRINYDNFPKQQDKKFLNNDFIKTKNRIHIIKIVIIIGVLLCILKLDTKKHQQSEEE